MGQNCCVAARGKSLPNRSTHEVSTYRNVRQSPTWSFRWDNRTHIEDIVENRTTFSHHNCGNSTSEVKGMVDVGTSGLSDGESPPKALQSSRCRNSFKNGLLENTKIIASDPSASSNSSLKGSLSHTASTQKPLASAKLEEPSSSNTMSIPSDPNSSRKAIRSPGLQLYRQISDSKILSPEGSHGGSSDGWSMRTFSELVASSQRERWSSLDDENFVITGKILGPCLERESEVFQNLQTCGICSKLMNDVPPWGTYPDAAVLACGHTFHADCLESLTAKADKHDPPCPSCTHNGLQELKNKKKNLIYQAKFACMDGEADSSTGHRKSGKIVETSSNMKRPFLRRHLSAGPKPAHSASENGTTRKKRFWPRYPTRE